MKFRKKPVEVEALQWRGMNHEEVKAFLGEDYVALSGEHNPRGKSKIMIRTLEGTIYADINDWIIRGVQGEHYPCKPDIFEATYDLVDTRAGGIQVTVTDTESGESETQTIENDYVIVTAGTCTAAAQAYANGTHVITVKGRRP